MKHVLIRLLTFSVMTYGFTVASGQTNDLFMGIEFKEAYKNGSRLANGEVANSYYQNSAKYDIKAKVNPATRKVDASASITYFNNFPEALNTIGFHAYKDLYEEGMIIKEMKIDGKSYNVENPAQVKKSFTHYSIYLGKSPLKQGDSLLLEIKWSITIPADVDRDGAYDKTSMLVAYWYPEIAVFDDIYGWDDIDFDGSAEFYHDFSSFKIEIEIPDNFVIWASDAPVNGDEIYPKKIRERLQEAKSGNSNVEIISKKDLEKKLKMDGNIWKYEADSFPDFSFAFSDHYLWSASSYTDKFGTYFLNSAYPEKNPTFSDVLDIEKETLESFHNEFPKHPFPFKHFVAFNGEKGGGMEFAGMCNDQARANYRSEGVPFSDYDANKLLTNHEMMHMYFPFLMGINEKRFAWMDEGMAEFSEDNFTNLNLESDRSRARFAKSENPPMMVQTFTTPKHAGINSYDIASQSYHALLHLLGKDLFDKCMKAYMERWQYKHPSPYDFFFTFNDISKQNLNWFWKAWYFDWGYPDMAIKQFENGTLTLENIGGRPIALNAVVTYQNNEIKSVAISPSVWETQTAYTLTIDNHQEVKSIEIKTFNGADAINDNNEWLAK